MRKSLVKKASIFGIIVLFVGSGGASALYENNVDSSKTLNHGAIYYVGPGGDYDKIQDAIDNASAGDTILVAPGRYYEHLMIWSYLNRLEIKKWDVASNYTTPELIGNGTGTGITIQASNVLIEALTITNYGQQSRDAGIYVEWNPQMQTSNVRIQNCSISKVYNGISMKREDGTGYIETAHGIYGNYIHNITMRGISIILIERNKIVGNIIKNCDFGFYIMDSNGNEIRGNHISRCARGGVIDVGVKNEFHKNNFIENGWGLWTVNTKGSIIQENNFIGNTEGPASFKTFFIINRPVNNDRWFKNYWGRFPLLLLVYPIFGVYINQFNEQVPWIRFDVLPAWEPN